MGSLIIAIVVSLIIIQADEVEKTKSLGEFIKWHVYC